MFHKITPALTRIMMLLMSTVLLIAGASAQVEQGRFVGHIQDPTGASIVGAVVEVRNVATNIVQRAQTDGSGDFVITPVPGGNYIVSVTAQGFQKATTKVIEVQVGQIVREDLLKLCAVDVEKTC